MNPATTGEFPSTISVSCFPPFTKTLAEFFAVKGLDAYLVGGVIRDTLIGRETNDIDVVVDGKVPVIANSLAEILGGRHFCLDDNRDIVRVMVPGEYENLTVDLTPLYGDIQDDLARRDFTLNSVAASLLDFGAEDSVVSIIDPHGGVEDARHGIIRAVSMSVFVDDPVRLMRAARLSAQLNLRVANGTEERIKHDAHLVKSVPQERIREELMKLIAEPNVALSLRLLDRFGLLCQVIPEIDKARKVGQPKEHYWDVFNHMIETTGQIEWLLQGSGNGTDFVRATMPRFPLMEEYFSREVSDGHSRLTLLKFAGLLHDIAKPETKTVEDTGRIRFLGHALLGQEVSSRVLSRLRFSGRGIDLIGCIIRHHMRPNQMAQRGRLPTRKAVYRYYRDVAGAAVDTLYLHLADFLAARGPMLNEEDWKEHCNITAHILQEEASMDSRRSVPMLVDGHEVMELLSIAPGPKVGEMLDSVREAQASGEIEFKEEALQLVKTKMLARCSGA